jgi:ATP-dependent DNA ligase
MLPRVQPIAAVRTKEPFDDPGWLFDFKYDGFRALCYLEQGRCRLMCANDLEGIVAKRLTDPYNPRARWLKIKNPGYSQNEGKRELFDRSSRKHQ